MKLERLKKTSDFQRVGKTGRKIGTTSFVLLAAPNEAAQTRIGYTVSKQVSKLAVERNRIKRRLRAAVKEVFPAFLSSSCSDTRIQLDSRVKPENDTIGMDYVIIGRKIILTREFQDIIKDMEYALRKIHSTGAN